MTPTSSLCTVFFSQALVCSVQKQKLNYNLTQNKISLVPLLKDHLFIQSLEKEGQEWLRGESAMGAVQRGGQLELELAYTGAVAPSERKVGAVCVCVGGVYLPRDTSVERERAGK